MNVEAILLDKFSIRFWRRSDFPPFPIGVAALQSRKHSVRGDGDNFRAVGNPKRVSSCRTRLIPRSWFCDRDPKRSVLPEICDAMGQLSALKKHKAVDVAEGQAVTTSIALSDAQTRFILR
jgi:hypothetical protein